MGVKKKVTSSVILGAFSVTQCGLLEAGATNKAKTSESLAKNLKNASNGKKKGLKIRKSLVKTKPKVESKSAEIKPEAISKKAKVETKGSNAPVSENVVAKAQNTNKEVSNNKNKSGKASNGKANVSTVAEKDKKKLRKTAKKPEIKAKDGPSKTEENKSEVKQNDKVNKNNAEKKTNDNKSTVTESKKNEKKISGTSDKASIVSKDKVDEKVANKDNKNLRKKVKELDTKPKAGSNESEAEKSEVEKKIDSSKDKAAEKEEIKSSSTTKGTKAVKTEAKGKASKSGNNEKIEKGENKSDSKVKKVDAGENKENKDKNLVKGVSGQPGADKNQKEGKSTEPKKTDEFDDAFGENGDVSTSGQSGDDGGTNNPFKDMDAGDAVIGGSLAIVGAKVADAKLNNNRLSNAISGFISGNRKQGAASDNGVEGKVNGNGAQSEKADVKNEETESESLWGWPYKAMFIPYRSFSTLANGEVKIPIFSPDPIGEAFANWANAVFKETFNKASGDLIKDWFSYNFNPIRTIIFTWGLFTNVFLPLLKNSPYLVSQLWSGLFDLSGMLAGKGNVATHFLFILLVIFLHYKVFYRGILKRFLKIDPYYFVYNHLNLNTEGKWQRKLLLTVRDFLRFVTSPAWGILASFGNFGRALYYEGVPATWDGLKGFILPSSFRILSPALHYFFSVRSFFGNSKALTLLTYANSDGKASRWVNDRGFRSFSGAEYAMRLNKKLGFFDEENNGEIDIEKIVEYAKNQIKLYYNPKKIDPKTGKEEEEDPDEKFLNSFIVVPSWNYGDDFGALPKRLLYIHDKVLDELVKFATEKKEDNKDLRENVKKYLKETKVYGKSVLDRYNEDISNARKILLNIQEVVNAGGNPAKNLVKENSALYSILKQKANLGLMETIKLLYMPRSKDMKEVDLKGLKNVFWPFVWIYNFSKSLSIGDKDEFLGKIDIEENLKRGRDDILKKLSDAKLSKLFFDLYSKEAEGENQEARNRRTESAIEVLNFAAGNKKISEFDKYDEFKGILDTGYNKVKSRYGKMENDLELVANLKKNLTLKKLIFASGMLFESWEQDDNHEQMHLANKFNNGDNNSKNYTRLLSIWFKNYGTGIVSADAGVKDVKKVSKVVLGIWAKDNLIEEIKKEDPNFDPENFVKFNDEVPNNTTTEHLIQKFGGKDLVPGLDFSAKGAAELLAELNNSDADVYAGGDGADPSKLKDRIDAFCNSIGKDIPTTREGAVETLGSIIGNFIDSASYKNENIIGDLKNLLHIGKSSDPNENEVGAAGLIISKLATSGNNENKGQKFRKLLIKGANNEVNIEFRDILAKYYDLRKETINRVGGCNNIADVLALVLCSNFGNGAGMLDVNSIKFKIMKGHNDQNAFSIDYSGFNDENLLPNELFGGLWSKLSEDLKKELAENDPLGQKKELTRLMQLLVPKDINGNLKVGYFRNNFASGVQQGALAKDADLNDNNGRLREIIKSNYNFSF